MKKDGDQVIDQKLVRAVAHPLRVEILEAMIGQEELSPTLISQRLEAKLGSVSYHVNVLRECGAIELVRTRQRRGALEHFFRPVPRSFVGHQDWRRVPESLMGGVSIAAFQSFVDRAIAAFEAGTIDEGPGTRLHWMPLTVDARGRDEIGEILDETVRRLTAIHAESAERLEGGAGEAISFIVGLAGFEAADVVAPDSDAGESAAGEAD